MKKFSIKIFIIISFCIFFPTAFTIFINGREKAPAINSQDSGKTIIIEDNFTKLKMDMEEFIPCVLVNQISIDSSSEAIKAQAVVLRSYILKFMGDKDSINAKDLNLPYITFEELKKIVDKDFPEYYQKLHKLVSETFGEVIKYDGKIIMPYFHGISAGKTRNAAEVFAEGEYPYLVSKESPEDLSAADYLTITYLSREEFSQKLKDFNREIIISDDNALETIQIVSRCSAGYISCVQIGSLTFTGDEIQKCFGLCSPYFEFEEYENEIRIICKGNGHGLGLSIYGAIKMAEKGSSYKDIINYYYTDVTIEK